MRMKLCMPSRCPNTCACTTMALTFTGEMSNCIPVSAFRNSRLYTNVCASLSSSCSSSLASTLLGAALTALLWVLGSAHGTGLLAEGPLCCCWPHSWSLPAAPPAVQLPAVPPVLQLAYALLHAAISGVQPPPYPLPLRCNFTSMPSVEMLSLLSPSGKSVCAGKTMLWMTACSESCFCRLL